MDEHTAGEYLYCALDIGQQLLQCGAEVNRVEDTIRRIMISAGAEKVEVFSITSNITVTAHLGGCRTVTQMRRIYAVHTDMKRLEDLNQLSRDICDHHLVPAEIRRRYHQILSFRPENESLMPLGYAVVSGSFTLFFGGDPWDALASALTGILLFYFEKLLRRMTANLLMTALLWSTAGGFLARLLLLIGIGHHADLISIGNIMLFIPGIALTDSIRNLFVGDTITGLIRFMESILLAATISAGFTFAVRIL